MAAFLVITGSPVTATATTRQRTLTGAGMCFGGVLLLVVLIVIKGGV